MQGHPPPLALVPKSLNAQEHTLGGMIGHLPFSSALPQAASTSYGQTQDPSQHSYP